MSDQPILQAGERIDNIGFSDLRLLQKPEEFCYGIDAVLLADFASKARPKTAIDLGTGTGIIPLILSHKTDANAIVGLEIQKDSFDRACRNSRINNLEDRIGFVHGDASDQDIEPVLLEKIKDISNVRSESDETKIEIDMVCTNPPYMVSNHALTNKNMAKAIARHESTASLEDFIALASRLLVKKGHFYMVHRPSRLADIVCFARKYDLEPKELRFVAPSQGAAPNILLVHCIKNAGAELKILEPLAVYKNDGTYTEEINAIYER